jgi:HAT1-interacting factor 1
MTLHLYKLVHDLISSILRTKEKGDDSPETADLYFAYGKALLENAISQATVIGKEKQEDTEDTEAPGASHPLVNSSSGG